MFKKQPRIAVVTREPRLAGLMQRWATRGQAKFVFRRSRAIVEAPSGDLKAVAAAEAEADEDFDELVDEAEGYRESTSQLVRSLDFGMPVQTVDRAFLPNFDFDMCEAVVVFGQDGLVANTAKYALEIPIVGVNPDPARFDGVLLPFQLREARGVVQRVLSGRAETRDVTLARATLHDGQTLLAFNDFFVGVKSHTSARYRLEVGGRSEEQSSSGVLISTGAGSTGWMSSVIHMARGVAGFLDQAFPSVTFAFPQARYGMAWDDRRLLWAVREPFVSRTSGADLVMGAVSEGDDLLIESLMSAGGVIFSDGVESDFLPLDAGSVARIGVAKERARLVTK